MLRPIPRRCSQLTAGLSTAARKRARTAQPMMVRTCHSKKRAASTTAADRRAMTAVRTTCDGAMRTHTTSSSEGVGVLGFVGSVCVVLCSPVSPIPSLAGSVCGPLRSPVSPLSSLISSPQLHSGDRDFYTTNTREPQSRTSGVDRRCRYERRQEVFCCTMKKYSAAIGPTSLSQDTNNPENSLLYVLVFSNVAFRGSDSAGYS